MLPKHRTKTVRTEVQVSPELDRIIQEITGKLDCTRSSLFLFGALSLCTRLTSLLVPGIRRDELLSALEGEFERELKKARGDG